MTPKQIAVRVIESVGAAGLIMLITVGVVLVYLIYKTMSGGG